MVVSGEMAAAGTRSLERMAAGGGAQRRAVDIVGQMVHVRD